MKKGVTLRDQKLRLTVMNIEKMIMKKKEKPTNTTEKKTRRNIKIRIKPRIRIEKFIGQTNGKKLAQKKRLPGRRK